MQQNPLTGATVVSTQSFIDGSCGQVFTNTGRLQAIQNIFGVLQVFNATLEITGYAF